MKKTKHSQQRFSQRGIQEKDLQVCIKIGQALGEQEIYVSNKAAEIEKREIDKEIKRLNERKRSIERVKGLKLVIANGLWITAYNPGKKNLKKMIRQGQAQSFRL